MKLESRDPLNDDNNGYEKIERFEDAC